MGTGGPPYTNPLRPRITIMTVDGEDTLYTYDAFEDDNEISIAECNMDNAIGETGTFNALINDHDNEIGKDNIHSVKCKLELGKTDSSFKTFLIGYADLFEINRPHTAAQFYNLVGFGSKLWLYQLYIHRHERYDKGSADAMIKNIIRNAFTKRLWRPLKKQDESIQDITGILPDGISNTINTPYRTIDETFVYFGSFLDKMADVTGGGWYVDFDGDDEILTFKNKTEMNTSIVIKSGDLADKVNDRGNKVSYIKDAFNVQDAQTTEAGFNNRLFSATVQDEQEMWPLDSVNYAKGTTNTTFKAIGQQIVLDNDARRIKSIELHLRKKGEPTSPNDRLNGGIFLDKNNKPNMTNTLDEFHIALSSIEEKGTKVVVPVDLSTKKLDVAQFKLWVVLFQRSNEEDGEDNPDGNGDPNHGEDHTILWGHNNSFNTTQTVNGQQVYSGQAPGGDFKSKSKLSWATNNQGPTYHVKVFSDIRRLFARTNGRSKKHNRLREVFVPTDFLDDPGDISRYLSVNLSQTSKGRRGIADFRVTVPDNFLYNAYQNVAFHDGLSDIDEVMQVQRASYSCVSGVTDDVPLGTLHATISLSGSYNTLVGACSCL